MQWELHFKDKTYIIHRSVDHFTPLARGIQLGRLLSNPPCIQHGLMFLTGFNQQYSGCGADLFCLAAA